MVYTIYGIWLLQIQRCQYSVFGLYSSRTGVYIHNYGFNTFTIYHIVMVFHAFIAVFEPYYKLSIS